jgi:hypothetical protein
VLNVSIDPLDSSDHVDEPVVIAGLGGAVAFYFECAAANAEYAVLVLKASTIPDHDSVGSSTPALLRIVHALDADIVDLLRRPRSARRRC